MAELPTHLAGLLPGVSEAVTPAAPAGDGYTPSNPAQRPPWHSDYNPMVDAPVVRLYPGAVKIGPNCWKFEGHLLDNNGQFLPPGICPICHTEYNDRGQMVGADFRYSVRIERPEHLFVRGKVVYEWTFCQRCLTVEQVEEVRNLTLFPGAQAPQRRRTR